MLEPDRRLDHLPRDSPEDSLVVDRHHPHERPGHGCALACLHPVYFLGRFGDWTEVVAIDRTLVSGESPRNDAGRCPSVCPHAFPQGCAHVGPVPKGGYRGSVAMRVVIADDSLLVRKGLEQVLAGQPNIEVVGSYADLPSLLEAVEADPPDVVLTDIRMPPSLSDEGIRIAALLRESHPEVGVVVLSQYAEPVYALALLESGSDRRAYLLKERVHDRAQLLSALETVADGGSFVDTRIVDVLVADKTRAERSSLAELTPREREVLAQIAQGKSNNAIADSLVLTKRAVEKHINSIFSKLDLSEAEDTSKRVKAALAFLSEAGEIGDGDPTSG